MAVQCVLVGKGKDDVFTAVYGETTFDKVVKAYNENKVVQMIYQNRVYYLDNATVINSPEAFSFISTFSNQNDENGEIKHWVITLMSGDNWSGPFLQKSTPAIHAKTHAKNGTDPLAPADIGAMELSENVLKQSNEDITSQVAQVLSGDLVPFSGGTMTGLLNVLTPVGDSNATTKKYVDDALSKKIGMDGIGDLHVWKKTVVTSEPVPAGYTLGTAGMVTLASGSVSNGMGNSTKVTVSVTDSISVLDNGTIIPGTVTAYYTYPGYATSSYVTLTRDVVAGKFIFVSSVGDSVQLEDAKLNEIYYATSNASFSNRTSDGRRYVDVYDLQKVIGTPAIPAGTTVTYPVSTNRNAYQEGSDAKPAGYTLGAVEVGKFALARGVDRTISYAMNVNGVAVNDDGTFNMLSTLPLTGANSSTMMNDAKVVIGSMIQQVSSYGSAYTDFPTGKTYFVPSDATTGSEGSTSYDITNYVTKRQPITGYPAIPANTTIEYLGCLGEKTRMQVVSYVGTGTYGASNPCSLTFDFPPKVVMFLGRYSSDPIYKQYFGESFSDVLYECDALVCALLSETYTSYTGLGKMSTSAYAKRSADGKTITWYNVYAYNQGNNQGQTYYYLGIG